MSSIRYQTASTGGFITFGKADIISIDYGDEYAVTFHGVQIAFKQDMSEFSRYKVVRFSDGAYICEINDEWPIVRIRAEIRQGMSERSMIKRKE